MRIQGLVWAYRSLRSESQKEAGGLGAWVTGVRPPGKSFMSSKSITMYKMHRRPSLKLEVKTG